MCRNCVLSEFPSLVSLLQGATYVGDVDIPMTRRKPRPLPAEVEIITQRQLFGDDSSISNGEKDDT